MARKGIPIICLAAILLVAVSPFAAAEEGDKIVRFGLVYSSPTDDSEIPGATAEVDGALGYQVGFEYLFSDLLGIAPAVLSTSHDVEVSGTVPVDLGEIDVFELTAALNFHVGSSEKVDFYVGPVLGYAFVGDLEDGESGSFDTKDQFIYGVTSGLDVPFGEGGWAFSAGLNYLLSELELEGGPVSADEIGIDPIEIKIGVAYSF